MENRRIVDSQITASSVWPDTNYLHPATNARLNRPHRYGGTSTAGGWAAADNNVHQWIQVDLGIANMVSGIVLQGREEHNQWVTEYKVDYSEDAVSWMWVMHVNQLDIMVRTILY